MNIRNVLSLLLTSVLLLTSYVSPTFAFENLQHFKTMAGKNRTPEGCSFRSGVMTIGRTFNSNTLNGTLQHRVFGTIEDVKKCYKYGAYVHIMESSVKAKDGSTNTGKIGVYSPEDTDGSSLQIADAVFNWLDWTNIAQLTVKVLSNDFKAEIRATQPTGTIHSRRIRATNAFGIDHANLPASVSSTTADKGVQADTLGFSTYFDITMYDELGKIESSGKVRYFVVNGLGETIGIWGEEMYIEHYMW